MKKRPLLHIIDGSGYIFRAYYAIRPLTTAHGEPTNAALGFATMIDKALRDENPTHFAITFDAGGNNFRKELYPEYKANRPPPPEDLATQIPRIHQIAEAFLLPSFNLEGYEADDTIATLVRIALEQDFDVRLITGDKDLFQLVSDRVTIFEPMRNQRFGPAEVEEKMGVPPHLVADALALAGDSSDNVPGVRGVGLKTAAKLLAKHGDLEGVLAAAAAKKVKGKMGENLAASVEDARLSRRLVSLDDHVALSVENVDELKYGGPDRERLKELYTELEFKKLIPKVSGEDDEEPEDVEIDGPKALGVSISRDKYRTITTDKQLETIVAELKAADRIGVWFEAETTQVVDTKIIGIALSGKKDKAVYIPLGHDEGEQLETKAVLAALKPIFEDAAIKKVSAELKSAVGILAREGITLAGLDFDTTIGSYLLEPDELQHGPVLVSRRYIGHEPLERSKILGTGKKAVAITAKSPEEMTPLVAELADIALVGTRAMRPALEDAQVESVSKDVELPLVPVLSRMERAGIRIDTDRLASMSKRFTEELKKLEAACFEAAGKEFNVGSPKQIEQILFEELELKIVKRTRTGRPSTDHSVLEVLADSHPLPQAILDHRQVQKLQSTYVEALPKLVSERTGRVHTVFSQSTAATGRLSSTDPNLQNIPIRSELGRELRKVFVAEPGNMLVSVDYSQIELRVLAHFSKDPLLLKAFEDRADVHTRTAAAIFQIDPDEVTREQRTQAKAVNFGVLYGMGPVRLARDLKIPRRTASQFVKDYFDRQPGVRAYIDATLDEAKKTGLVRTILGRRRIISDINSKNRGARAAAERIATNTPIQGSAADLMKLAMIRVDAVLAEEHPKAQILLQVHDELLVEAPEAETEAVANLVQREMQNIFPMEVPLDAEAHWGPNWDDAH